jgi:Na+-driven multidrug efflux pump
MTAQTLTSDPKMIGLVVLAGLGLLAVFSSGAKAGRKSERAVREVTRIGGNAARMLVTAAVIVGVQWAALFATGDPVVWAVVLGLPALFAGTTVARLFAVTEVIRTTGRVRGSGRRGGGRR